MSRSLIRYSLVVLGTATLASGPVLADMSGRPSAPEKRTPAELVGALHEAFGSHHARAVHTKGLVLEGQFEPDARAADLTRAAHLQRTASKITVRFSDFTGIPDIPDNAPEANPRGLAVRFTLPDGSTTDIVGHSFDGFPTATSDDFRDLLIAISKSGPAAAKPTPLDAFLGAHPIAKTFLTTQKTPASFATITYFGVNAFRFTNARDAASYVRYQFVPEGGEQLLTPAQVAKKGPTYLQDEIRDRVAHHPVKFRFFAQIAAPGDAITDPSIAWPATRRRVPLGTLTITRLAANTPEEDRALAFSPGNVPDGIEPADPMIGFRTRAYPISVKERQ